MSYLQDEWELKIRFKIVIEWRIIIYTKTISYEKNKKKYNLNGLNSINFLNITRVG